MVPTEATTAAMHGFALDLDGVLIDGMPYHFEAFTRATSMYGVYPTVREIALLEGMRTREIIRRVCLARGVSLSERDLEEAERAKRRLYKELFEVVPLEGATDLVQYLVSRCCVAIVTGTSERSAVMTLKAMGVDDGISIIVSHDSNVAAKPDPAPYSTAAQRMALPPGKCIAVENAPAGISSARGAGMTCYALASTLNDGDLREANRVFKTHAELVGFLQHDLFRDRPPTKQST